MGKEVLKAVRFIGPMRTYVTNGYTFRRGSILSVRNKVADYLLKERSTHFVAVADNDPDLAEVTNPLPVVYPSGGFTDRAQAAEAVKVLGLPDLGGGASLLEYNNAIYRVVSIWDYYADPDAVESEEESVQTSAKEVTEVEEASKAVIPESLADALLDAEFINPDNGSDFNDDGHLNLTTLYGVMNKRIMRDEATQAVEGLIELSTAKGLVYTGQTDQDAVRALQNFQQEENQE